MGAKHFSNNCNKKTERPNSLWQLGYPHGVIIYKRILELSAFRRSEFGFFIGLLSKNKMKQAGLSKKSWDLQHLTNGQ